MKLTGWDGRLLYKDDDGWIRLFDPTNIMVCQTRNIHDAVDIVRAMAAHDALVAACQAALEDGGLFQATELQIEEALKLARGEE